LWGATANAVPIAPGSELSINGAAAATKSRMFGCPGMPGMSTLNPMT